ncbi:hypothetical protein HETIRDRAFT_171142 [Heterobasidion irregulare TC 32-1]|uniref:Uncharacterized protein n=1 Tax=Heterobasidion irregulare (strain TC 32-1) TaxID=747525 RepID=W4KFY0_HETIT|nr:uncharacterized protein HETIRDRAFT_171142 [Heterobasidion irregulare TC 32-1]ETW84634.1 hypothetical protein HETIRDRAFT_171142 [Heterobasidion irregulare TC 32-1]
MSSGYHDLVIHWNTQTLSHPKNPYKTINNATYYLIDNEVIELLGILLKSEWSLEY